MPSAAQKKRESPEFTGISHFANANIRNIFAKSKSGISALTLSPFRVCKIASRQHYRLRRAPPILRNMKKFYLRYNEGDTKLRQAVAVLPWSHNLLLMSHDLSPEYIVFYANEVVFKGWSRPQLPPISPRGVNLRRQALSVCKIIRTFAADLSCEGCLRPTCDGELSEQLNLE